MLKVETVLGQLWVHDVRIVKTMRLKVFSYAIIKLYVYEYLWSIIRTALRAMIAGTVVIATTASRFECFSSLKTSSEA